VGQHFAHVAQAHRGQLEGSLEPRAPSSGEERPSERGQGTCLDRLVVGDPLGSRAIARVAAQHLGEGAGGADAGAHQQQVRPRAADLLQALVEPQGPMQLGFGVHLEAIEGKAGEGAETLAARLVADADRQHADAGRLQPRQDRHQGLGVFEAVEIPQLAEQQHESALATPHPVHPRQPLKQGSGCGRPGLGGG
jgi:hypothetical protein